MSEINDALVGGAAMDTGEPVDGGDSGQAIEAEQPVQPSDGSGQQPQQDKTMTLTQEDLDRIIASRVARVKREPGPGDALISELAKEYGMTPEQYIERVKEVRERRRQEAEQARYREAGIDPNIIDERVDNHPVVQQAKQYLTMEQQRVQEEKAFAEEVNEFEAYCKDAGITVKPEEVPKEAWILREKSRRQGKPITLTEAFLRVKFPTLRTDTEQNVIKGLQSSAQASPGSLGQSAPVTAKSFSEMTDEEFEEYSRRVEAGEIKIE